MLERFASNQFCGILDGSNRSRSKVWLKALRLPYRRSNRQGLGCRSLSFDVVPVMLPLGFFNRTIRTEQSALLGNLLEIVSVWQKIG
jgi:hypothetical protein